MKALVMLLVGVMFTAPAFAVDPNAPASWTEPREPFHIYGNAWYVGTMGISSVLLHSPEGSILIDGGMPKSAPLIAANIRKLGFKLEDIRIIVNSHAHYDHAGGIAELQRLSGARVYVSPGSRYAFEHGDLALTDPQSAFGHDHNSFPAVAKVSTLKDGETLRVGPLAITARFTPGHTEGGTTWTWRECEAQKCVAMVYADSLNSVSAPGFRFTGSPKSPSRVEQFNASIDRIAGLECDLLWAPHPELIDLEGKLSRLKPGADNPFIGKNACVDYALAARARLEKRIAEERASPASTR
jgi:metallo-beta-lactamase class B